MLVSELFEGDGDPDVSWLIAAENTDGCWL
jgi:hypothetical protein